VLAQAPSPATMQSPVSDAGLRGGAHDPRRAAAADGAGRAPVVGPAVLIAICGVGAIGAVIADLQPSTSLLRQGDIRTCATIKSIRATQALHPCRMCNAATAHLPHALPQCRPHPTCCGAASSRGAAMTAHLGCCFQLLCFRRIKSSNCVCRCLRCRLVCSEPVVAGLAGVGAPDATAHKEHSSCHVPSEALQ
jgi:hypothetical protein